MAKDVINVGGEEKVVREDTAKSYRGVIWALTSVVVFIAILLILFFTGLFSSLTGSDSMESPASVEQQRR
ncbi:MAG TPA: hypothetical protein VK892_23345 [Pyrinomonadaceae bacterium]|nr:hypothetical protein [Pyrinomonadaceae bacterium]